MSFYKTLLPPLLLRVKDRDENLQQDALEALDELVCSSIRCKQRKEEEDEEREGEEGPVDNIGLYSEKGGGEISSECERTCSGESSLLHYPGPQFSMKVRKQKQRR